MSEGHGGADQECGSNQKDERERDFNDDEDGASLVLAEARSRPAAALLERRGQVGLGALKRRDEPEQDPGRERHAEREYRHAPVEADQRAVDTDARQASSVDREQCANANQAEE